MSIRWVVDQNVELAFINRTVLFDSNITPVGLVQGLDPQQWLRHFDPTTWQLSYEGDTFDLAAVFTEASAVWAKAETAYRRLVGR